jgi:hypothetical protein
MTTPAIETNLPVQRKPFALTAPNQWHCTNDAGNKALHGHASTLVSKLVAIDTNTTLTYKERRLRTKSVILTYMRTYFRYCCTYSGQENDAANSMTRDAVWSFTVDAAGAMDVEITAYVIETLWDIANTSIYG